MDNRYLTGALLAMLGIAGSIEARAGDGTAEKLGKTYKNASVVLIASNSSKGSEASCKGKESSCKGKESSCKGKESSCKGKENISYVGGAAMYPSKDIIDNAVNSPEHTTLVTAVKAAGLVDTLKGPGPFTVFAPTDKAFKALPAGTVDNLLKPESKEKLAKILTYHVVPGKVDAASLKELITSGGGSAKLKTVEGEELTAKMKGKKVELVDSKGDVAYVSQADVYQSNGVIHVVDKVLMPQ